MYTFHYTISILPHYLAKVRSSNLWYFQKKQSKLVSHLTKTEASLVIWLNIVTIVARSVRFLPAYVREDVHATHQLHCQ